MSTICPAEQAAKLLLRRIHQLRGDGKLFHPARRQPELEVAEDAFTDGHQTAGAGALRRSQFSQTAKPVILELAHDSVSVESALVLMDETALALSQHIEQVVSVEA